MDLNDELHSIFPKFEKYILSLSDEEFNKRIPIILLQIDDELVNAVSFVFWITYKVESDFRRILIANLEKTKNNSGDEYDLMIQWVNKETFGEKNTSESLDEFIEGLPEPSKKQLSKIIKENYNLKKNSDVRDPKYSIDLIRIQEFYFGKDDRSKLLWKLNDLRNHVCHCRFEQLIYKGGELKDRKNREKLLLDYFRLSLDVSANQSPLMARLTEEQNSSNTQGV